MSGTSKPESIVVENVTKRFTLQYERTIKQMTVAMLRGQKISDSFPAVDDVSFTIRQGESVGLMGLNGSGKSTLLKLINGIMRPDSGTVLHARHDRGPHRHGNRFPPAALRTRQHLPQRRHPRDE